MTCEGDAGNRRKAPAAAILTKSAMIAMLSCDFFQKGLGIGVPVFVSSVFSESEL